MRYPEAPAIPHRAERDASEVDGIPLGLEPFDHGPEHHAEDRYSLLNRVGLAVILLATLGMAVTGIYALVRIAVVVGSLVQEGMR